MMPATKTQTHLPTLEAQWLAVALVVCGYCLGLALLSSKFGYDREVVDMPVLLAATTFVCAGFLFGWVLPGLIERSAAASPQGSANLVLILVVAGLAARLILFASEPILEDDYQRYLWDGAVTAHGMNPYVSAPRAVIDAGGTHDLASLASQSGHVIRRINHPQLTTIYPPVSQAAFTLAHWVSPWSLTAWRSVLLVCDAATLLIVLSLLSATGRSPLWSALYWLNPLVLKEGFNSAHMEPLVVFLVMLTLWLAAKNRTTLSIAALAVAAGAKVWPLLLLPIVVRPLAGDRLKLAGALAVFAGVLGLLALPVLAGDWGETSGFRAYAETWKTNSALFPLLESTASQVLGALQITGISAALAVKAVIAAVLVFFAFLQARAPITTTENLIWRAAILVAALVLLSPAQYPWYLMWLLPFLAFWPSRSVLLLCATIPLYYASFHFAARETLETARPILLALIWGPVWTCAAFEMWRTPINNGPQPQFARNPL
jgi:alpha-1,6-mannosyltransferase